MLEEGNPLDLKRRTCSATEKPHCSVCINAHGDTGIVGHLKNDILQSLGLDLSNINVYAEVYENIPPSSRDKAIFFFFFQNVVLGKASTDENVILQKSHFFRI